MEIYCLQFGSPGIAEMTTNSEARPPIWQTLLAFSIIYLVWGSTFLAIRIGVREIPPLLMAALRFLVAGILLYGWMRLRGTPSPTRREWLGGTLLGALIFLIDYGCLFWAEQRVPSGVTAVVLATIPVFITLLEISILRTQRLTVRLAGALALGICGVAVLMAHSFSLGEAPINPAGAAALLIASFTWSLATILSRKIAQPASKPMSAAVQMLSGGVLLLIAALLFGEFSGFHGQAVSRGAWFALAYLITAGSIVGFTAYVWLLHYESPTKVGTYAYVNPVVAVLLGYFLGGEVVGARTLLGTLCVLVSVIAIATMRAHSRPGPAVEPKASPGFGGLSDAEAD
jgi:drug/metabolite transporter (DMT)-like permease